jgi:cobalt/nickel transport system permease protein
LAIKNITGNSLLSSVDTRVKWVGVFITAITILAIPDFAWAVYILIASILISIAIGSALPLSKVLKRTFLVELPLLLILIPLPFIRPENSVIQLAIWGIHISISLSELVRISVLMVRSWLIILSMVLFTMTTPADEMLASLSAMHVPAVLVTIILFMWRYLSLFAELAHSMSAARELRSIPPLKGSHYKKTAWGWNIKKTGSMLGSLFVRAYERSERIYQAMLLRGFDGSIRSGFYERLGSSQILQILFIILLAICFIIGAYGIYGK